MRYALAIGIVFSVLLIDQITKIWVKTSMYLGQKIPILGDFFTIHFVENPGMAFGLEFGGDYGKLFLTLFRIVAVILIGILLTQLCKNKTRTGIIFGIALIMAGAMGNIIDSLFYGMFFSESSYYIKTPAALFPPEGYASLFHGKVVDMLHFQLIDGYWPQWLPFWGGSRFEFFRPIFNIADSAITVGIIYLLLFQRSFFTESSNTISNKQKEILSSGNKDEQLISDQSDTI